MVLVYCYIYITMIILITGGNGNLATILKTSLSKIYTIESPARNEMNMLDMDSIKQYLQNRTFDVVIHTAIQGGRRTKPDTHEHIYNNMLMLENLLWFKDKFEMIINLDSGAIYNREEDILNRKETDIYSVPKDYYGFSKYMIHQRGLAFDNFFNLRIFNIFHETEEPDRFISRCINVAKEGGVVEIFENKYFDFFYKDDFVEVVQYYIRHLHMKHQIPTTLNLSYKEKHTLAEVAKMILGKDTDKVVVYKDLCDKNYCGDGSLLLELKVEMKGIKYGINNMINYEA
jgi:nucleoside-diphosphate-sugar epimerase